MAAGPRPAVADDDSSTVIITATDSPAGDGQADHAGVAPATPAEPSELVIHTEDDAPATEEPVEPPRGDLTVIANSARPASVDAPIADSEVVPAAHQQNGRSRTNGWGGILGVGGRRPAPSAGIQSQRPVRRPAVQAAGARRSPTPVAASRLDDAPLPYDAAPSRNAAPAATVQSPAMTAAALEKLKSPNDHAKELLVNAYQLSLSAKTEAEYSQIVQWCTSALRVELDAESRQFSKKLCAWALNRRGQSRAEEGQNDLALADFAAALDSAPDNWRAMHNRAVTFAQAGQFAEAFDDVCRVIQLNPKFAKAYANRATLYVQAGEYDLAVADYDAALAQDPQLLTALIGRARVCHMQGKLDDALESFNAAVAAEPKDAEIVCSRADLLCDLGRYEDALLDYAQAIDLNSKFEHAYRNGAWLLATCPDDSIRDVDGALAGAQAALDCGYGERHAALDTMAAALANAGRFEEAVGTIQQAIDIAPESVRAGYQARQQLYESSQPFRSQPVGADTAEVEASDDGAQAAVYIEE
jgi:tetratricopeptide (TPR) repeat protein